MKKTRIADKTKKEEEKIIITEESREQGRHKIEAEFNRSQVRFRLEQGGVNSICVKKSITRATK